MSLKVIQLLGDKMDKKNITRVCQSLLNNEIQYLDLFNVAMGNDLRKAGLALWVMSDACVIDNNYSSQYVIELIKLFNENKSPTINRNIVKIWQEIDFKFLNEELKFPIIDTCIQCLKKPDEAIAVKAYAISTLKNSIKYTPEIIEEVSIEIEKLIPKATPAYKCRINDYFKTVNKISKINLKG